MTRTERGIEQVSKLVVLRDDRGKIEAVGATQEEAEERKRKLDETPKANEDPNRESDGPNPEWIKVRAEAIGLTLEQYQALVDQKVEDIGELVACYGVDGAVRMIEVDMRLRDGEKRHRVKKELDAVMKEKDTPVMEKKLGVNQAKREELARHYNRQTHERFPGIQIDTDIDLGFFDASKLSDDELSEREQADYDQMKEDKKLRRGMDGDAVKN